MPYPLLKRLIDRALSAVLMLLLAPFAALVMTVIALDALLSKRDRGSLLYRERRISRGRQFDLLKFRTLRPEALAAMRRGSGYARQYEADPAQLTWAGRHVLKPWYLDELPQLFNVFRGDMSLVGPRPWPAVAAEEQARGGYDYRYRAQAGWTGPSQVEKGRAATGTALDLAYVSACRRWSSWHLAGYDLLLLGRSIRVVLRGEGLCD